MAESREWAYRGFALVPRERSRPGIERLRGARFAGRIYPGGRHELFNELNADEVIADVTEFIRNELNAR